MFRVSIDLHRILGKENLYNPEHPIKVLFFDNKTAPRSIDRFGFNTS